MASKTIGIRLNKKTSTMIKSIRNVCSYDDKTDGQILVDALELYYLENAREANRDFIKAMIEAIHSREETYSGQLTYVEELFRSISDILEVLSISNLTLLSDEFSGFLLVNCLGCDLSITNPEDEGVSFNDTRQYSMVWEKVCLPIKCKRINDYDCTTLESEVTEEVVKIKSEEYLTKATIEVELKINADLELIKQVFEELIGF